MLWPTAVVNADDSDLVDVQLTKQQVTYLRHLLVEAGNSNQHSEAGFFTEDLFAELGKIPSLPALD